MPLPKPKQGESEQDFISRCIPVVMGEAEDNEQAAAICYSQWRAKSVNEELLTAIHTRNGSKSPFGYGITTADRYVAMFRDCVGIDKAYRYAAKGMTSFSDLMEKLVIPFAA